ncbi:MAG: DUF4296 domain-containing protein [Flavobacteriaceae bacterium]|nr:DUF4296 domain-containing protein [Flavobacteriaceae bacterium]
MMKKIIYMFLVLTLMSCKNKVNYKKPKDLIPREQMINLLYDMHIVNATQGVRDKDLEKNKNYMSLIYEKHKIDSTQFAASNIYYIANISEYEDIFEEVKFRLEILLEVYEKERDSLIKKELDSNQISRKPMRINRRMKINKNRTKK